MTDDGDVRFFDEPRDSSQQQQQLRTRNARVSTEVSQEHERRLCSCIDFTLHTGLRYCSCSCSDVRAHAHAAQEQCDDRVDSLGLSARAKRRYNHHDYIRELEDFSHCSSATLNVTIELIIGLYVVLVAQVYVLVSVFPALHLGHPALAHVLDIVVPAALSHAKFHNSIPVIRGSIALVCASICCKIMFVFSNAYLTVARVPVCESFEPCKQHPWILCSVVVSSIVLVVIGVYAVVIMQRYKKMIHCARKICERHYQ